MTKEFPVPQFSKDEKKHFLSIISIFKNEADVMKEWIEHHLLQGVDKFILIDNGSTDKFMEVLKPFIEDNIVTLHTDVRKHAQEPIMIDMVNRYMNSSTWVSHIDMDEFLYVRPYHGIDTVASLLDYLTKKARVQYGKDLAVISFPWTLFGSSGHVKQPPSVRTHFTMCEGKSHFQTKYIARFSYLDTDDFFHHQPILNEAKDGVLLNACLQKYDDRSKVKTIHWNCHYSSQKFVLNHYRLMSWNRYRETKMARGDVYEQSLEDKYDEKYFKESNKKLNQVDCLELANFVKSGGLWKKQFETPKKAKIIKS